MILGDIGDVPTLSNLNKPQKRALILRDQLRYLEPAHLDSYLNGVAADEPPTYKHINGAVYPPLAQVTIKDDATRFDLGNVQFPEEGGATFRAYLTVEDGRFEMRTEDALPKDDAELLSASIHRFVAENMFPLYKAKYKAIHARMEKINEARRVAYNMLDHPPAKFEDGETLARLNPAKSKAVEDGIRGGNTRKRKEIVKHASNKRQRIGLETIPESIKSETFNAIPAQVKVNLFDNIIKTAFPNFDNLIVASWNVVSIYANVGSDFPELHTAIVELKGALEEFETAYAPSRTKSGKNRKGSTPVRQTGGGEERTPAPVKEARGTPVPTATSRAATASQEKEENSVSCQRYQDDGYTSQHQMPPPRNPQASPSQQNDLLDSNQHRHDSLFEEKRQPDPPQTVPSSTRAHSTPRLNPETLWPTPRSSPPNSTSPSPNAPHRTLKPRNHSIDTHPPPAPGAELMRKRQAYTASLSKTNRNSTGAALGHPAQRADDGDEEEQLFGDGHGDALQRPGSGGGQARFGSSVLGVKKMGSAPVAPMMCGRRDGGGRRGY